MSRIKTIELFHVEVPLPAPFFPCWIPGYPQTENRFTLARLTTDDGVQGIATGMAFEREHAGLGGLIGGYLLDLDTSDIMGVRQRLREASYLGWRNYWLETAFWDIKAKLADLPLYQLLQREAGFAQTRIEEVPIYASSGELRPLDARCSYLDAVRGMGVPAVKLRAHQLDWHADLDLIRACRKHVGDTYRLMVDANQGWRVSLIDPAPLWDLKVARDFVTAAKDLSITWLEEPLDMHGYDDLAALRSESPIPIAGGELNGGKHEFAVMLEKGCFDVYQPDALLAEGIGTSLWVMKECATRGLRFSPHMWTHGIGMLTNLHLFAACPESVRTPFIEYPYEPPGLEPTTRDALLPAPITVTERGTINVPQSPGLGVTIDEKALSRLGKRFYRLTPAKLAWQTIRKKGLKTALELKKKKQSQQPGKTIG
jgi:L-alanine-DL-glutamate epimerase-like enolase superfamily enzyme